MVAFGHPNHFQIKMSTYFYLGGTGDGGGLLSLIIINLYWPIIIGMPVRMCHIIDTCFAVQPQKFPHFAAAILAEWLGFAVCMLLLLFIFFCVQFDSSQSKAVSFSCRYHPVQ